MDLLDDGGVPDLRVLLEEPSNGSEPVDGLDPYAVLFLVRFERGELVVIIVGLCLFDLAVDDLNQLLFHLGKLCRLEV